MARASKPINLSVEDVVEAVSRKRVAKIRDAFRALVHWPRAGTINGIATADEALALLQTTAAALVRIHDTRVMPYETMAVLERIAAETGGAIVGGWYATGAAFVLDRLEWWRPRLRPTAALGSPLAAVLEETSE